MCNWRLSLFAKFMKYEFNVFEAEKVKPLHIKKYIQYRQELNREQNITINNHLAILKVFSTI